jgi:hypothetical protein
MPTYREELEQYYREKSKIKEKNLKIVNPKSKVKLNEKKFKQSFQIIQEQIDNPYTSAGNTLKRKYFMNEKAILYNLNSRIISLINKVKQYELDILYDLHESIEEYDKTVADLESIKKKYKEIIDEKNRREKKEEYTKQLKKDEISRLIDSYKISTEITDKKEMYKEFQDKKNNYYSIYNRMDVVTEKQRVKIDDNDKNKDETNIIVNRCIVNYEPIVDILININ